MKKNLSRLLALALVLASLLSLTVGAFADGTKVVIPNKISRLEAQLGFPLFQRSPALELTKTGELFLGYARRIQDAYDLANNAFSSVFSK